MRRRSRTLIVPLAVSILAACGSGGAASPSDGPSTVANVGELPGTLPPGPPPSPPADSPLATISVEDGEDPGAVPTATTYSNGGGTAEPGRIGTLATGNDLLVLGDSILEATSARYGNTMCEELVPRGWAVEVDAENGRDAGGGLAVLEDRLAEGEEWDAAVVMLGNNYRDDPEQLDEQLGGILDLLAPSPVLLLTVSEFESDQEVVNYVIRSLAAERPGVALLEWARRTEFDDSLTGGDGLHLTDRGREVIASMVGVALGAAPAGSIGECLDEG